MKWTLLVAVVAVSTVGLYFAVKQDASEKSPLATAEESVSDGMSVPESGDIAKAPQGVQRFPSPQSDQSDGEASAESAPRHIGEPLDVDNYEPRDSKPRHIGEWIDPDDPRDDSRTEVSHIGEPMSVDDDSAYRENSVVRHIGEPLPPPEEYYGGWSRRDEATPKHIGEPMEVEGAY